MRESLFVSNADPNKLVVVPSLSFLLRHSASGSLILFDLGIRKHLTEYTPRTQTSIQRYFGPCKGDPDVVDSLKSLHSPLEPKDISHVILSHIHW
jgi:glyoxylase-like metal-dependent hydrolase (beta-lactamase superfamily II)